MGQNEASIRETLDDALREAGFPNKRTVSKRDPNLRPSGPRAL